MCSGWFDIDQRAYTLAWADLDGDNDLDAVATTYQTEHTREDPADLAGGGVVVYINEDDQFEPTHLALRAQALAALLADLNGDGRLDIWVGNDFLLPDHIWFWSPDGWTEAQPFPVTAQNTMSLEAGDIDNDGQMEFFAADMMPMHDDAETQAAWMPLMKKTPAVPVEGQAVENVLLSSDSADGFQQVAKKAGLLASGWS